MDEKKANDMLDAWAEHEQSSAPRLRPTRELYALLETRRRTSWYPVMARWATVGLAAAVIAIVAVLHPSMIPAPFFHGKDLPQHVGDDGRELEETRNETSAPDVASIRKSEQDVAQGVATVPSEGPADRLKTEEIFADVVEQDKQTLAQKPDEGTEPAPMPADMPEIAAVPPSPASETLTVRQRERLVNEQIAGIDEKQAGEPLAARSASVADKGRDAPTTSSEPTTASVPGEQRFAAPEPERPGTATDVGATHSKPAARRALEPTGAVRADHDSFPDMPADHDEREPVPGSFADEQKTLPLADLVLADQMAKMVDCTPLPDGSASSSADAAVGGRSVSAPATWAETSEEAESELSTMSPTPAAPRICAIRTAEKTLGAKTFRLQGSVWVDADYDEAQAATQARLVIRRDSQAYADLLTLVPDLRVYAESGDHILISLKTLSIEIAPEGRTALTDRDVLLLEALPATPSGSVTEP